MLGDLEIGSFRNETLVKLQAGNSEGGMCTDLAASADPNHEGDGDTIDSGSFHGETLDDFQIGSFWNEMHDNEAAEDQEQAAEAEEDEEEAEAEEDEEEAQSDDGQWRQPVETAVEEQWSQPWIGHPRHMRPINAWTWQEWHNWGGRQAMGQPSFDQQHSQGTDAMDGTAEVVDWSQQGAKVVDWSQQGDTADASSDAFEPH